ncbi:MAG: hypothetical protein HY958_05945 [Bacteroidia bacterium]|nr:hypothetical protein [Bacteroidia bacterium]
MAKTKGRIEVPQNVEELLILAGKVYDKHVADGAASKLTALEDYNWTLIGPTIVTCLAKHNTAEEHKAKMEKSYRERDLLLPGIEGAVRSSITLLKGIYAKSPKKLGDWGLSIDDTKPLKKKSES